MVDAPAVHPAGQVRGHGDVRGDRHDRIADRQATERGEHAAERLLRRQHLGVGLVDRLGNARGRRRRRRGEERRQRAKVAGLRRVGGELGPLLTGPDTQGRAHRLDLRRAGDHRVVERITGERQPPALDRVREDHRRSIALLPGRSIRLEDEGEVVAADVADQGRQGVVGDVGQQPVELRVDAAVGDADQRLAQPARGQPQEPLILGDRHRLEPRAQALAARPREARLQSPAPAGLVDAPAARPEHVGELARARVRHDAVEALAVHVDDPQHVAEPADEVFAEHLPDVALVELGIADHHDESLGHGDAAVVDEIARGEAAERRGDGAESHRACREIHDGRVLAAARIRLQSAENAQRLQIGGAEPAAQVLDRVERR